MKELYLYYAIRKNELDSVLSKGLEPENILPDINNDLFEYIELCLNAKKEKECFARNHDLNSEEVVVLKVNLNNLKQTSFDGDYLACQLKKREIVSCSYYSKISPKFLIECDVNKEPKQILDDFKGTFLYEKLLEFYQQTRKEQRASNRRLHEHVINSIMLPQIVANAKSDYDEIKKIPINKETGCTEKEWQWFPEGTPEETLYNYLEDYWKIPLNYIKKLTEEEILAKLLKLSLKKRKDICNVA